MQTLEDNGLNLSNISGILSGAEAKAKQTFEDLYNLWFDSEEKKTQYLQTLKDNSVNLFNISGVLHGTGAKAKQTFEDLYNLWFDGEGKKHNICKLENTTVEIYILYLVF